jgi:hypothetical protein
MICPKTNKNCKPISKIPAGRHYICSGLNSRPRKYSKDIVKLCLKGKYVKDFSIEMTPHEALYIIRALVTTIAK